MIEIYVNILRLYTRHISLSQLIVFLSLYNLSKHGSYYTVISSVVSVKYVEVTQKCVVINSGVSNLKSNTFS